MKRVAKQGRTRQLRVVWPGVASHKKHTSVSKSSLLIYGTANEATYHASELKVSLGETVTSIKPSMMQLKFMIAITLLLSIEASASSTDPIPQESIIQTDSPEPLPEKVFQSRYSVQGDIGLMTPFVFGTGVSMGWRALETLSLEAGYLRATLRFGGTSGISEFGRVRLLWFPFKSRLFLGGGIAYRSQDLRGNRFYNRRLIWGNDGGVSLKSSGEQMEFHTRGVVSDLSIGHRWYIKRFFIGVNWAGIMTPQVELRHEEPEVSSTDTHHETKQQDINFGRSLISSSNYYLVLCHLGYTF